MEINLKINLPAKAGHSYPIVIAPQLLTNWAQWLPNYARSKKIVIISDSTVAELYGQQLAANMNAAGYLVRLLTFPAGEFSKSANTKLELEEQMFAFGVDRHTLCLALGGGVVGDLAGFTAATYMRGIQFIQIPTSLLAMIDSSVGGKTAVNTSYGKNIIGAFWQPLAVMMDCDLLKTLPTEQVVNGLFEAVKIFLTSDRGHFEYCAKQLDSIINLDYQPLTKVIKRAVELKAQVVEIDEQELNLRMILNFGHTVGHALEKLSNFSVLHGFGVGLGMIVEAYIAKLSGLLAANDYAIIEQFLLTMGVDLALLNKYDHNEIITAMRGDKKNINQQIKLVLLTEIGSVKNIDNQVAFSVSDELILSALSDLTKRVGS